MRRSAYAAHKRICAMRTNSMNPSLCVLSFSRRYCRAVHRSPTPNHVLLLLQLCDIFLQVVNMLLHMYMRDLMHARIKTVSDAHETPRAHEDEGCREPADVVPLRLISRASAVEMTMKSRT